MNQESSPEAPSRIMHRPLPIIIATAGLALTYTIGTVGTFSKLDMGQPAAVAILLGFCVLFLAMVLGIYAGHKWARWFTLLLVITGLFGLRRTLADTPPSAALTRHLILLAVQTASAALLFFPTANRWFSRDRNASSGAGFSER